MYGKEAIAVAQELFDKYKSYDFESLWNACSCALGYFEPYTDMQKIYKNHIINFSNMFDGDIKKATYALKDMYNINLWNKLKESYINVDYRDMSEEESTINMQGELACAGGKCII